MARLLLESEADILAKTRDGKTPLNTAARYDSFQVASILLNYGKAERDEMINTADASLFTPFCAAALSDSIRVAALLVDNGVNVSSKCRDGTTALHWAAVYDASKVASFLISEGADVNALLGEIL